MVAVHRPTHRRPARSRIPVRPSVVDGGRHRSRSHLRLVEGGASAPERTRSASIVPTISTTPSSVLSVAAVIATLTLVFLVRGVQGAPPAADWESLADETSAATATSGAPVVAAGQATLVVGIDDTWASIAAEVAPHADPVEVARQLAAVNGGYALRPGQVLIIPLPS